MSTENETPAEAVDRRIRRLASLLEMLAMRVHAAERHEETRCDVPGFYYCTNSLCRMAREAAEEAP